MKNRIYLFSPVVLWIVLLIASLLWNIRVVDSNLAGTINSIGRSFFKEIETTRLWNARHGGVYVPITMETQPNIYLDVPNRDITSIDGLKLTKINPAFMTRQIAEIAKLESNIQYHITSLNPIRPANKADEWETEALKGFNTGNKELLSLRHEETAYRYMAPLLVKKACLKCHAKQGYQLGDVRGGISVTIPAKGYVDTVKTSKNNLIIIHLIALVLGCGAFYLFKKSRDEQMMHTEQKNLKLEQTKTAVESANTMLQEEIIAREEGADELSREKIFSETLINSLPGIFYLIGADGRQIRRNKNHESVTGYSNEEFHNLHVLDMFPEKERIRVEKVISEVLSQKEANIEANILTKDDVEIPYFITARKMIIDNEVFIIGTGNDISERKKIEDNLRKNMIELERLSKLTFGREQMMISLKEEINQLLAQLGKEKKYKIVGR